MPAPLASPRLPDPAPLRRRLRTWFASSARDLPWRRAPSLYTTVVSEFMLQQTRVDTVLGYFSRWLERFPDFPTLAAAPAEEVLAAWSGLGYYARARHLHRLAQALAALPAPPRTAAAWRELPGVGPYTAAAIASLAFQDPTPVVDGNVVRVLARLLDRREIFRDGAEAVRQLTPAAAALLDPRQPGRHNEALMELGATVCLPRQPRCPACPWQSRCAAHARGQPGDTPRFRPRPRQQASVHRWWDLQPEGLLLHRVPEDARRLAGFYELPLLAEGVGEQLLSSGAARALARPTRTIATQTIREIILGPVPPDAPAALPPAALPPSPTLARHALDRWEALPVSGPHRRWIRALLRRNP